MVEDPLDIRSFQTEIIITRFWGEGCTVTIEHKRWMLSAERNCKPGILRHQVVLRHSEFISRTKLSWHVWVFCLSTVFFYVPVTDKWRGLRDTCGSAMWSGKHSYLAKVRDFYNHRVIIHWEGLFPWFAINSHEHMVSCTIVKLETDSLYLHKTENNDIIMRGREGGGGLEVKYWFWCLFLNS